MTMIATPRGEALPVQRVLLVEDDLVLRHLFQRLLAQAGFDVAVASDGEEGANMVLAGDYCAVLTDFDMPKMSGVDLLRCVRAHGLDVPVILVTGAADLAVAREAIGHGVFQLLTKPVAPGLLVAEATRAARQHSLATARRGAMRRFGVDELDGAERKRLATTFRSAVAGLWMAFQPVVDRSGRVYGYEALLRSNNPLLPTPATVLDAAERLGLMGHLGLVTRERSAVEMFGGDPEVSLFVNVHAGDLFDDSLLDTSSALLAIAPRVVLEVTERASLQTLPGLSERLRVLREAGFRLAIDDLGAGYAGLSSLTLVRPEIVKLDLSVVRHVHVDSMKQRLVRMITDASSSMGIVVVAEGIELAEERDALMHLGCDLFQGHFIAKPGRPFPSVTWLPSGPPSSPGTGPAGSFSAALRVMPPAVPS